MKISLVIDDQTGAMNIVVDPPETSPVLVSWMLRKAEAAVFTPPEPQERPRVAVAPAAALRKLPGLNGS